MPPTAEPEPDHLVLTDPRALRALAHPARTAVLDELYQGKVRTSSQLAELTGLTPSAMSYHLRALEKWGIVVRSDSADGRERPWRRAARGFSWSGEGEGGAADTLTGLYLNRLAADLAQWRRSEPPQGDPWHDLSVMNRGFPWLTADEVHELTDAVVQRLRAFRDRTEDDHPEGARRVAYLFAAVPLPEDVPAPADAPTA